MSSMNNPPPGWGGGQNHHSPWGSAPQSQPPVPPSEKPQTPMPQQTPSVAEQPVQPPVSVQPAFRGGETGSSSGNVPPVPPQPAKKSPLGFVAILCAMVLVAFASVFIGIKLASKKQNVLEASSAADSTTTQTTAADQQSEMNSTAASLDSESAVSTTVTSGSENAYSSVTAATTISTTSALVTSTAAATTVTTVKPATTSKVTTTAKAVTTTTTTMTTAAKMPGSIKEYPSVDIDIYPEYHTAIVECFSSDGTEFAEIPSDILDIHDVYYCLIDINADDNPELILYDKNSYILKLYTTINGNHIQLLDNTSSYGGVWSPEAGMTNSGYFTFSSGGGGGSAISFSHYVKGQTMTEDGAVIWRGDSVVYQSADGKEHSITEQEAQSIIASYGEKMRLFQ